MSLSSVISHSYARILLLLLFLAICLLACNNKENSNTENEIKQELAKRNPDLIQEIKSILAEGDINKKMGCHFDKPVFQFYKNNNYLPFWSDTGKENTYANLFIKYLDTCEFDGLIKHDFSYDNIKVLWANLKNNSSSSKTETKQWAKIDILLSNAFFNVCNDLKRGRLFADSLSWRNDTTKFISFFANQAKAFARVSNPNIFFRDLQPKYHDYKVLRNQMQTFIKSKDTTKYKFVDQYLLKRNKNDSLVFYNKLFQRFQQEKLINANVYFNDYPDSILLSNTVKLWQKKHGIHEDGLITSDLLKDINLTDQYKHIRYLLTLDRYKLLPDSIKEDYIFVNIPAFHLKFWDADTVALFSKVICGRQSSPTPSITSAVKEIVTMPTWTVPSSIIRKEMLPQLRRNPRYLSRRGLSLYDHNGNRVNPEAVNWSKYSAGIPYKIRQKSGINNALGVIKFVFDNDHDVYLHDTNQRYLFEKNKRALSHGCVRVEKWMELAEIIAAKDSIFSSAKTSLGYNADSIANWIGKGKHRKIAVKHPVPVILTYLTVESVSDKLIFHADIYGDDERMIRNYFSKVNL